jgi:hypothetical protein
MKIINKFGPTLYYSVYSSAQNPPSFSQQGSIANGATVIIPTPDTNGAAYVVGLGMTQEGANNDSFYAGAGDAGLGLDANATVTIAVTG